MPAFRGPVELLHTAIGSIYVCISYIVMIEVQIACEEEFGRQRLIQCCFDCGLKHYQKDPARHLEPETFGLFCRPARLF